MGKRVLVADDSATIQRAFSMVFGNREDVSLVPARSLDEAVAAARQGRPDLVIADANLGGRTGYELCSAIKSDAGLRGVPVYILASSHSPYDDGKGRSAGVDGHLTKPFESQALIDKVLEILARPTSIAATVTSPRAEPLAPTPQMARPGRQQPARSRRRRRSRPPPRARRRSACRRRPRRSRAQAHDDDDDYGEFKIERSSGAAAHAARCAPGRQRPARGLGPRRAGGVGAAPTSFASPARRRPAVWPVRLRPASPPPVADAGRRPAPVADPGRAPRRRRPAGCPTARSATPAAGGLGGAARARSPPSPPASVPPPPSAPAPISAHGSLSAPAGRTIMGLPAVAIPGVPVRPTSTPPVSPRPAPGMPGMRAPATGPVPLQPVPAREVPTGELRPAPAARGARRAVALGAGRLARFPPISARPPQSNRPAGLDQKLDQKLAAISAKGPEYEAIAKLSREIIEQVVWEVVPELAEVIIREHVERLAQTRK